MSAGVLTMAYGPKQYVRMAKGLSRSIRLRSPDTKLAIISDRPAQTLKKWFDIVIPMRPQYGPGLVQKLHLDRYTPFEETLFIDSDFLIYKDFRAVWARFSVAKGFGIVGYHLAPNEDHYAIDDLPRFMSRLRLSRMIMTNTGIVYFDTSSAAARVFELARKLAGDAAELGVRQHPAGSYNDEPLFAAAVEMLDVPLVPLEPLVFTLGAFGTESMRGLDIRRHNSRHVFAGAEVEPLAIHFNVDSQRSRVYDRELRRLEFGPWLGKTVLPTATTNLVWLGRRARSLAAARATR